MTQKEIIAEIETLAPKELALEWDNIGLILGEENKEIDSVLLTLDINRQVVKEALEKKADLIITHHPPIVKPIRSLTTATAQGSMMIELLKNNISLYTCHTNLDICACGVNDTLFNLLELTDKKLLKEYENGYSLGRLGRLNKACTLFEFTEFVKEKLAVDIIRYVGYENSEITTVALCGGAASSVDMFDIASEKGADVYLTGDIRYHDAMYAKGLELNLIDASHYATEHYAMGDLKEYLEKSFPGVAFYVSQVDLQPFKGL